MHLIALAGQPSAAQQQFVGSAPAGCIGKAVELRLHVCPRTVARGLRQRRQNLHDGRAGRSHKVKVMPGRRQLHGRGNRLDPHVDKARFGQKLCGQARFAQAAQRAGLEWRAGARPACLRAVAIKMAIHGLACGCENTAAAKRPPSRNAPAMLLKASCGCGQNIKPRRDTAASKPLPASPSACASATRVVTCVNPAARALAAASSRMRGEMSVASTAPWLPTRRAMSSVCPPAPAATSSTRAPSAMPAAVSMASVIPRSQSLTSVEWRFQPWAALSQGWSGASGTD